MAEKRGREGHGDRVDNKAALKGSANSKSQPSPSSAEDNNKSSGYSSASSSALESVTQIDDHDNGEALSTGEESQQSTTSVASTGTGSTVPVTERQTKCAEPQALLPANTGGRDISTKCFQCTQNVEEVGYRVTVGNHKMCGHEPNPIFVKNVVTSIPLNSPYICLDADGRKRIIDSHHEDCDYSECGNATHTKPAPAVNCKGKEELPVQCSDKCHRGVLVL